MSDSLQPPPPIYTFPQPPPPPWSLPSHPATRAQAAQPEQVKSFGSKFLTTALMLFVFGAIVAVVIFVSIPNNTTQQASMQQPQGTARIATSHGQIQTVCLRSLQGYATCWALDLPATGEWIRWLSPTSAPTTITGASGVVARGCQGEIYDLGKGGQSFNGSCGHLDYRATDGRAHTIYEGVK